MSSRFVSRMLACWLCAFAQLVAALLLLVYSRGQGYGPACVGVRHCFPFRFVFCIIWCSFLSVVTFLQYVAVAVELELLGGSSSLFPSILFIAMHHPGVTRSRAQSWGRSWRAAALPQPR